MTDLDAIRQRIEEDSEALRRSNGSFRLCEHRLILSLADRRALLAEVEGLRTRVAELEIEVRCLDQDVAHLESLPPPSTS